MPLIELDFPDIIPRELFAAIGDEAVQAELANIAESARNHWIGLAQRYLHTTRATYIRGIQKVQLTPGVAIISLVGVLPNMLENGATIVNLRDWLLGPNVPTVPRGQRGKHRAKDGGFYRSIPFRHQTPGSSGTQAPPMGDPYRGVVAGAAEIGRTVYKHARKLKSRQQTDAAGDPVDRLPAGLAPQLKEHHKTDIYSGMVRVEAGYSGEGKDAVKQTGGYMTFRTISTNVPEGWIRPPTLPRHFAQKTSRFVARIAPMAFQAHVEAALKGAGK